MTAVGATGRIAAAVAVRRPTAATVSAARLSCTARQTTENRAPTTARAIARSWLSSTPATTAAATTTSVGAFLVSHTELEVRNLHSKLVINYTQQSYLKTIIQMIKRFSYLRS